MFHFLSHTGEHEITTTLVEVHPSLRRFPSCLCSKQLARLVQGSNSSKRSAEKRAPHYARQEKGSYRQYQGLTKQWVAHTAHTMTTRRSRATRALCKRTSQVSPCCRNQSCPLFFRTASVCNHTLVAAAAAANEQPKHRLATQPPNPAKKSPAAPATRLKQSLRLPTTQVSSRKKKTPPPQNKKKHILPTSSFAGASAST